MRLRRFLWIAAAGVMGVIILTATTAIAVRRGPSPKIVAPQPPATAPLVAVVPQAATVAQAASAPQAATVAAAPCLATAESAPAGSAGPLPRLGPALLGDLGAYAKNAPAYASVGAWYDSGGSFGGGVPAVAVRAVIRRGLANGLDTSQARSLMNPSLLRGMNDPRGGAWLFRFVAQRNDPGFYQALAAYAQSLGSASLSPMSAQADVFEAFPLLQAAYMAQAGAIPPDQGTASLMVQLGNQGYAPAQRSIDAIIAAGNHPAAGAQNAGGVGSHVLAYIYDYLVVNYHGPLSRDARQAVANRGAYMSWVDRIAAWEAAGLLIANVPTPARFPAAAAPAVSTAC